MHPRTCMVVGLLKNCNALISLLLGSFGACVCVHRWGLMYLCELVEASVSCLYLTFYFRFWGSVSHCIWSTLFWLLWLASSQGILHAEFTNGSPCLPDFYVGLGYWTWVLTLLWQGLYPIEPSLLYLSLCFIECKGNRFLWHNCVCELARAGLEISVYAFGMASSFYRKEAFGPERWLVCTHTMN